VQNFWVNGIVLVGMAVYPFFFVSALYIDDMLRFDYTTDLKSNRKMSDQVPGFFGGLSLAFAGICFIIAAIKKEKGESLENLKGNFSLKLVLIIVLPNKIFCVLYVR
jgi:hypothetical protein